MKIINIDKKQKESKMKYILPIVKSGVALGLTCYLVQTGVLEYNNLVNLDNMREVFNNVPLINSTFLLGKSPVDISVGLTEQVINTIGIQGIVLASKSFNFAKSLSTPILQNDKVKNSTTVHKIKSVLKGKDYEKKEQEKENKTRKSPKALKGLIRKGLSIGAMAYLIATHQIDYNMVYNKCSEVLPHKISDMINHIDFNKIKLGVSSLSGIKSFLMQRHIEKEEGLPLVQSINFKGIIKKISKENVLPTFSSFKSTEETFLSLSNCETLENEQNERE